MAEIGGPLKWTHLIAPSLSLAAVVAWNVSAHRLVKEQEAGNLELKERIAAAREGGNPDFADGPAAGKRKPLKSGSGTLDWKAIAAKAGNPADGSAMDLKSVLELNRHLEGMTDIQILAAFDEIDAMGLDPKRKEALEELLIDPFIEKNPELALQRFADRIGVDDDAIGWRLSAAMAGWAKLDPAAATAWLDKQIAAGRFDSRTLDGRSEARIEFEGALAGELLGSSAALVAQRIAALPEDQRREALGQIPFADLDPAAREAYVGLVRSLVPADERAGSFSHVIADLVPEGGFAEVEGFLNRVRATPEERQISAREAANTQLGTIAEDREVTGRDVDAMRAWVEKQAPGTVDRVTGESLGEAAQDGGEFDFAAASKLALEYHKRSASDDVLAAFLESFAARSNSGMALPLLENIRDPELREKLRESLQ